MFIGARTHATIAAYSSCVPTLVVGYSIKARGIAKDLFGTDEGYVLPVQALAKGGNAFPVQLPRLVHDLGEIVILHTVLALHCGPALLYWA